MYNYIILEIKKTIWYILIRLSVNENVYKVGPSRARILALPLPIPYSQHIFVGLNTNDVFGTWGKWEKRKWEGNCTIQKFRFFIHILFLFKPNNGRIFLKIFLPSFLFFFFSTCSNVWTPHEYVIKKKRVLRYHVKVP